MPATLIVGAQWGDEGKGKITDLLAQKADFVARYNGGDNAGHTVVFKGQTFRLHHIPSGILYPGVICILGNGMVINPERLCQELDELASRGVDVSPSRLKISGRAHLVLPFHIALDKAEEVTRGKGAIGTTFRGIGPAYSEKFARRGIRIADMLEEDFAEKVERAAERANRLLKDLYDSEPLDPHSIAQKQLEYARRLTPYIEDVSWVINEALKEGKKVLCEGAQGTFLDIDHGTYPFVTSSHPVAGGAMVGLGFGPKWVEKVIGVTKAYTTRVGGGPFPTELTDEIGEHLAEIGREYGTTTGRRRRTGWLDMVALRYAIMVNGITELAVTKLDVLTGIDPIRVCVAYRFQGIETQRFPLSTAGLFHCEPVYAEMPGWKEDISEAKSFEELPAQARDYILFVEKLAQVPVRIISVGPEREQVIIRMNV
ncbi:MAG: adenylosuccinate synthase [Anaerolineae bacterium]|nr:adenylosuccinate synthase [Anaerolineae bacterium]MDW8103221.1 adenylosuccinate synthase [Anaerolineae bacterium]